MPTPLPLRGTVQRIRATWGKWDLKSGERDKERASKAGSLLDLVTIAGVALCVLKSDLWLDALSSQ